MLDVLMQMGHFYSAYRVFQDSGAWFFEINKTQIQEYLETLAMSKGLLPNE